jgi:hypothetical protein
MTSREQFELFMKSPPFERDCHRWPNDETRYSFPNTYKEMDVDLAWEAWQAARAWKKATEEMPKNKSPVLIKFCGEVSGNIYTYFEKEFVYESDFELSTFNDLNNIEWQYLPE